MSRYLFIAWLLLAAPLQAQDAPVEAADAESADADSAVVEPAAKEEAAAPKRASSSGTQQMDNLNLDATVIKGNAELPKVLYIVPWQSATAGDLDGRPVNSLLDEVFSPVDRDVFLRHVDYFGQLSANPATDGAQ